MAIKLRRLDIREFKNLVNGQESIPDDVMLTKDCAAEVKAVDASKREVSIVFSTESVDRDGDIINQRGIDLRAYRQNPVVLFAHNYSDLPVARSMKIFQTEGRTRSVSVDRFADRDLNPLADTVFRMLTHETPFLNAASIGFRPVKFEIRELEEEDRQQFFFPASFLKVEKLEHSIVPVPANSEALQGAKSVGIDLGPVAAWAARVLDEGIKSGSMTREHIERCWDIANREVRSFVVPNMESVEDGDVVLMDQKGSAPSDPPSFGKQDPEEAWSAPNLRDFTDQVFEDLSAGERRAIARHFAWAENMPPENFGQLKLPHHDAESHSVNLRGVNAAVAVLNGARGGVNIPSGDKDPVGAHLNRHRRAYGLDPVEIRMVKETEMKEFLERLAKEIADQEKCSPEDARKALDVAIAAAIGEAKKDEDASRWTKEDLTFVVGKAVEGIRAKEQPAEKPAPAAEAPKSEPAVAPEKATEAKGNEEEFDFPSIKDEEEARKASVDEQVSEIRTGQRQILGLLKQVVDVLMSITVTGDEPAMPEDEDEDKDEDEDEDEKSVADDDVALMLEDDEPEAQDGKSEGDDILAFISQETANAVTRALEERSGRLPS